MKKIIGGHVYDTDTAKCVGTYENMSDSNDLDYFREQLFCKRNGEFFLYGSGNARSQYGHQYSQNSWEGGALISPLSLIEAQKWAEENLSGDEYKKIFGAAQKDKIQISGWIGPDIKARLDKAKRENVKAQSLEAVVEAGLEALGF